ncbi:MAG TPA: rhamnan synthesis F family protein [Bacteroidia bacterium]|nr:rhamnan synthesis F family protein [Bacteroidia bacterium]HRH08551.1 rhamnan synthesis F family protein [Bacteroidia bacterium]
MKTICFFSSYFKGDSLPYYCEIYLLELKKHFNEVVLLTTKKPNLSACNILNENGIELFIVNNEGFDFGMWSKAFDKYPVENYDRIALVNDSCILFAPLNRFMDWVNTTSADCYAISESHAISYHLQSYFMLLNKKAILALKNHFKQTGIQANIGDVIRKYEIGISTTWLTNGLVLKAFLSNNGYQGEFSPYYYLIDAHLKQGSPMIKKKIIYSSYRKDELFTLLRMNFEIDPKYYLEKIKQLQGTHLLLSYEKLLADLPQQMSTFEKFMYRLKKSVFQFAKRLLRK